MGGRPWTIQTSHGSACKLVTPCLFFDPPGATRVSRSRDEQPRVGPPMSHPRGRRPDAWGFATERVVGGGNPGAPSSSIVVSLLSFLLSWAMVGFVLGTAVLVGPLAWLIEVSARSGWSSLVESGAALLLVTLYFLGSAFCAYVLERWRRSGGVVPGVIVPAVLVGVTAWTAWTWMNPRLAEEGEVVLELDGRFAFGAYPTERMLESMVQREFTGVISLLHPAAIPVEPRLISMGKKRAEALGLDFVSAPMLPWGASDERAEAVLRRYGSARVGRYYVHSYLGRSRVTRARAVIEDAVERGSLAWRLRDKEMFERGLVVQLERDVFLTPFPTPAELDDFFLDGSPGAVLSLMDPDNGSDREWLDFERSLLQDVDIPLYVATVKPAPYDPNAALAAARRARGLPRPLVVHAFFTESVASEAFVQAYLMDRPPLPPSLFEEPMDGGGIEVLAPNVAVGPRPIAREFGSLYNRGIGVVSHVGPQGAPGLAQDAYLTAIAGLRWYDPRGDTDALLDSLGVGGPWYLYGSTEEFASDVAARHGPAIPRRVADSPDPAGEGSVR